MHLIFWYLTTGFIFQIYLSEHDWLHQLCKKFTKETIFNIWRNDNFFFSFAYLSAVWLLFGQNRIEIIVDEIFVLDFAQIVTKQQPNS